MSSVNIFQDIQKHIPLVGNLNTKSPIASQVTRKAIALNTTVLLAGGEAYINGLEIPDPVLKSLLNTSVNLCYKYFPFFLVPYEWLSKESDRLTEGSQELMEIQYNLPEKLFRLMLEEDDLLYPKYTMALWEKGILKLEQAQIQMIDDVINKAQIQDGDEILELGCGWGSAANYILSKFPNVKVTGLNLSREQCGYMRNKQQDPMSYLSADRFTLYEQDFHDAQFEKKFDKIIAIGLFEHIGNLSQSFQKLATSLKDDGKVFIHIISTKLPYNITDPFINKYIFPNMRVWSFDAIPKVSKDLKTINQWFLKGENYAATLKIWLSNFDQNQTELKELNYGMNYAQFRRIWRLYLLLCIAYFEGLDGEILGNGQYLLVRA